MNPFKKRCKSATCPRMVVRELINHAWQMLETLLNCRCYEAEDSLRTDSLKNRTFNAFNDPGKAGGILF